MGLRLRLGGRAVSLGSRPASTGQQERTTRFVTVLNFAAAVAGLIAAWRWQQATTIRAPTELPASTGYDGPLIVARRLLPSLRRSAALLDHDARNLTEAAQPHALARKSRQKRL